MSDPEESPSRACVQHAAQARRHCQTPRLVIEADPGTGSRLAGITVDQQADKTLHTSAPDLRRAFGTRWARHVPPLVLKDMMRHASVTTTERYYVDIEADATAAMLTELIQQRDTSEKPAMTDAS